MCHLLKHWTKLGSQSLTIRPAVRRSSGVTVWETPWFVLGSEIQKGPQLHARWEKKFNGEIREDAVYSTALTPVGLSPTGWLRWPSAMPGWAWPLGGSWHCKLWSHWMHGGKQAQRLHSHCSLHPMDRGHTHQGFLLALNSHLQKFPAHNCWHRKSRGSNRFSAMSLSGSGPWTCLFICDPCSGSWCTASQSPATKLG